MTCEGHLGWPAELVLELGLELGLVALGCRALRGDKGLATAHAGGDLVPLAGQSLCAAATALPAWKEQEATVAALVVATEAEAPQCQEWPASNWVVAEGQAGPAPEEMACQAWASSSLLSWPEWPGHLALQ